MQTKRNGETFAISIGLRQELESRKSAVDEINQHLDSSSDYDSFVTSMNKWIPVKQIAFFEEGWNRNSYILDVGFGWGITSLYLAKRGHHVTGVEPSKESINFAEHAAQKFGLMFNTVNSTAEEMDEFLKREYDIVIFNSSLHHCDNPIQGLKAAYNKLKSDGTIYLIEPSLRAWRSKSWYFQKLKSDPVKMGHYGGNEHIYRSKEYRKMLEDSGFKKINYFPSFSITDFREIVTQKLKLKIDHKYVYSLSDIGIRILYYLILERTLKSRLSFLISEKLSLSDVIYIAEK